MQKQIVRPLPVQIGMLIPPGKESRIYMRVFHEGFSWMIRQSGRSPSSKPVIVSDAAQLFRCVESGDLHFGIMQTKEDGRISSEILDTWRQHNTCNAVAEQRCWFVNESKCCSQFHMISAKTHISSPVNRNKTVFVFTTEGTDGAAKVFNRINGLNLQLLLFEILNCDAGKTTYYVELMRSNGHNWPIPLDRAFDDVAQDVHHIGTFNGF